MREIFAELTETVRAMWRHRWLGVAVAWGLSVVGAVTLTLLPDRFEATARVYVDTKTVLRPLLSGLAVEPDLEQTVDLLARTLLTRPNAEVLMRKASLDASAPSRADRERIISGLLHDIKITGSGRDKHDNVFEFAYRDTDPVRARLVVENLISLFLESDTGAKRRDAEAARGFIDEQIRNYEARLAEAESRLKEFKLRNLGVADTSGKDFFARMSTLTDQMSNLSLELRAAEQSRDAIRRELGSELAASERPEEVVVEVPEYDTRLDAQRKQLDDLLRRFTEQHPDVVATRRLIAGLEEERRREVELRRKAAASRPARAPAVGDPVRQQIRLALAEAEAKVASLRVRAGDMQARLAQLRASASRVPQIEAEMAQLNRDYEVLRVTYQSMVNRREKATLSEDVDATRAAQFRIIDPPRTSPQPVFPKNRLLLAPLVLLAALAAGVASTFAMVRMLPTFEHSRHLRSITQRPVLGSVSLVLSSAMLQHARRDRFALGAVLAALMLAGGLWMAWIHTHVQLRF